MGVLVDYTDTDRGGSARDTLSNLVTRMGLDYHPHGGLCKQPFLAVLGQPQDFSEQGFDGEIGRAHV